MSSYTRAEAREWAREKLVGAVNCTIPSFTNDLRGINDATDYFVIASGTSDAHVRGIAESVMEKMGRRGFRTHHVEGVVGGRWVLLDFVDFVVHLFHPETRAFYQLERLWNDAPELLTGSS